MEKFKTYLSLEIGIEFKAFLYFYCLILFYCVYQLVGGSMEANIIILAEMIATTYIMGYLQVYFMRNFDESDHFGIYELVATLGCTLIYTAVSYVLRWYDRKMGVTILFLFYMIFCYVCAFLLYKVKRDIDTKMLNKDLEDFKKKMRRKNDETGTDKGICD